MLSGMSRSSVHARSNGTNGTWESMIIGLRFCSVAARMCGVSKIDEDGTEIMIDWLWAISIDEFGYSEYLGMWMGYEN